MTLKDLRIKLQGLIPGIVDKPLMDKIGTEVVDIVKTRTTKGFGVQAEGGPQTPLKGLSESYKKQRRRLKAQGKLSDKTAVNKSNLHKSGEMVESINHQADNNSVTIKPTGSRNEKKVKYQAEAGRIAFNLSKSEKQKVLKIINEEIKNDIKKKGL